MRPEHWLFTIPLRLRSLFRWAQADQELDDELRDHLERRTEEYVAQGMKKEEAHRRARLDLGGIEQTKEKCRDARPINWIQDLAQDLRYGLRMLRKSPGFTAVAVLTLALGIGANTAIFSLVDAVLLDSLPVHDPQRLVLVSQKWSGPLSYPLYEGIRDQNQAFSGLIAFHAFPRWSVEAKGESELISGQLASGNYFSVLGIKPAAGRLLAPEDDTTPGAHPFAVISYKLWKRKFAFNLSTIGETIYIFGHPFRIVGVTPPQFVGTQPSTLPDVTIPITMQSSVIPGVSFLDDKDVRWLYVIGRLKPGVSQEQALADSNVVFQQQLKADAGPQTSPAQERDISRQTLELSSGSQGLNNLRKRFSFPLRILMAIVGMVLLIACTNLASLLLARASARRREIAVRLAIGAGRLRLIRQLLTESMLLAVSGGALGAAFAYWAHIWLVTLFVIELNVTPNLHVFEFSAAVCLISAILFGLAPALPATRADLISALKRGSDAFGLRRLDRVLVTAQVALSTILLFGGALFVRSLQNLEHVDSGFNSSHLLLVSTDPRFHGYDGSRLVEFYKELLSKIEAAPFVQSATLATGVPLGGLSWFQKLAIPGSQVKPEDVSVEHVGARFFETFGIRVLDGRDFDARDNETAPRVIAINESLARNYFLHDNPIGKRTGLGMIVAVVKDSKFVTLRDSAGPMVYRPFLQEPLSWDAKVLAIRTVGDPSQAVPLVRQAIREVDSKVPIIGINTMAHEVDDSLRQERTFAALTSLFGLLALGLACIGLYALLSYEVARSTNEIRVRMALGAGRSNVLKLVLGGGMRLALTGVALGSVASLGLARFISSQLYGLRSDDPLTFAAVSVLLLVLAVLASYIPARRAMRVDPIVALRYE